MLRVFCFVSLCLLLTACGKKDEHKLPQVCNDLFTTIEDLNVKAETNPYVSATLAGNVRRFNARKLENTKTSLFKTTDTNLQTQNCSLNLSLFQGVINELDKAKTKEEAEKVLFRFK